MSRPQSNMGVPLVGPTAHSPLGSNAAPFDLTALPAAHSYPATQSTYPGHQQPCYYSPPARTLTAEEKEKTQAWKYRGYRSFSRWMASDDDFFVIRKFGHSNARCILQMQDRIQWLEEELEAQDKKCQRDDCHAGRFRPQPGLNPKQCEIRKSWLIGEMTTALERYNNFIVSHSKIKSRPEANAKQIGNVRQWLDNNRYAIEEDEQNFIGAEGDLMALVPKRRVPLRRCIEKYLSVITELDFFQDKKLEQDETTIYNKEARIDKAMTFIVVAVGVCMLLGPLWLLQVGILHGWSTTYLLAIISGFIVAFTMLLGLVTVAQPFEVLAAAAAYAAVLTVFLQIGGAGPPGHGT